METKNYLNRLVGAELTGIGRAVDMLWLTFENDMAIHIQTDAVFSLDGQLVTRASDVYLETGRPDVGGNRPQTRYDVKAAELLHSGRIFRLSELYLTPEMGLSMKFTAGLEINVFLYPETLPDDEVWRIFERHSDSPHMVAYKTGIEW